VEDTVTNNLKELHHFVLSVKGTKDDSNTFARDNLIPVLLHAYRDLSRIRYDYPVVLINNNPGKPVLSLTAIINEILSNIAGDAYEKEKIRQFLFGLESEIKKSIKDKKITNLSEIWDFSAKVLIEKKYKKDKKDKDDLEENLNYAKSLLRYDGEILNCERETSFKMISHLWENSNGIKYLEIINKLKILKIGLSDILKVDLLKTTSGKKPGALKESIGSHYENDLDFNVMSDVLITSLRENLLSDKRKARIEKTLDVLKSQKFFNLISETNGSGAGKKNYLFVMDSCKDALENIKKRKGEMIELLKAVSIAELEIENKYDEKIHDEYFQSYDINSVKSAELGIFPSYLIFLREEKMDNSDKSILIELLSSDLPVNIVFSTEDVLKESGLSEDKNSLTGWNSNLAPMALNLIKPYIIQTVDSHLASVAEEISEGLKYNGPALFSIYSGSSNTNESIPNYLVSASSLESRAFPSFIHNPSGNGSGGENPKWDSKFTLSMNPQPEKDWPVNSFIYEDDDNQVMTEEPAFTFADFLSMDKRYACYFKKVSRANWNNEMIPVSEFLLSDDKSGKLPYILMIDSNGSFFRVIVKKSLIDLVSQCEDIWNNLQELGGINNSHALKLLDDEKKRWEDEKNKEIEKLRAELGMKAEAKAEVPTVGEKAPEAVPEAEEEKKPVEEAFINSERCTTCNDCTERNGQMFAYNENKQAYIKDIAKGTFRELVEAAENCPVCIIHPGKPTNPDESGLDELIKRAESFNLV